MANDVLYDNLGILSLPPQVQQTCDIGSPVDAHYTCNMHFLANGGLPRNLLPITDPAAARAATSALHSQPDAAVFGNLDGREFSTSLPTSTRGSALRRNPGYSPAGADPSEHSAPGSAPTQHPADFTAAPPRRIWIRCRSRWIARAGCSIRLLFMATRTGGFLPGSSTRFHQQHRGL